MQVAVNQTNFKSTVEIKGKKKGVLIQGKTTHFLKMWII